MPNPKNPAGPAPAPAPAPAPVAAAPVNAAPVNAAPVNAADEKSMAREITKRSALAGQWEELYDKAGATQEEFENLAANVSTGLVQEFHKKKKVSEKSATGRTEAFRDKEALRQQARDVHDAQDPAEDRTAVEKKIDAAWQKDEAAFAAMVRRLAKDDIDYMEFKDDANFLKHYAESVRNLKEMQALYSALSQVSPVAYAALSKRLKKKGEKELAPLFEVRKKALNAVYILDYYEARMDVIRNPFYTVLKESDTQALSKEDKKKLAESYASKNNPKLAAYFDALYRMDEAASLGAEHKGESRKALLRYGNSGRRRNKWRLDFLSFKQSGSFLKTDNLSDDNGAAYEALSKGRRKKKDGPEPEKETGDEISIGGTYEVAEYKAKLKGAKGSVKKKWGIFSFGANASVLALKTENALSANLGLNYKKGKGFKAAADQGGTAKVSATGALAQGRIKAGLDYGAVALQLKAKGKALTAKASASANAGRITWKDKNGEEHTDFAASAIVEAGAALAEGEVSGAFSLFGVKIGASFAAQFGGAGGVLGGAVTGSAVQASFGALFGLGFKLTVKLDVSGVIDYFKNRRKKKKLEDNQASEYAKKNRGRTLPAKKKANTGAAGGPAPTGAGPPKANP